MQRKNKLNRFQLQVDHSITVAIILFVLVLFTALQLTAQENKKNNLIEDNTNKEKVVQSTIIPNAPQVTGDTVSVKDDAGNVLMTVTDEGSAGSIKLNNAGAVTPSTNKLYNNGGSLYWNGSAVGSGGGADSINNLADAKYDGSSLFVGESAGLNDDGTVNNITAIGKDALRNNNSGHHNTAVGKSAMFDNTSGFWNSAYGFGALFANTTGTTNCAFGMNALQRNKIGSGNAAFGYYANFYNVNGSNNTAIGYEAGKGSDGLSQSGNVLLGFQAGYSETGSNKLYIENSNSLTPLIWGDFANDEVEINGDFHVTGNITSDGTSPGVTEINDLTDAKTGGNSIFLGSSAGSNDDGSDNKNYGLGINSLFSTNTGFANLAMGFNTLYFNSTGNQNIGLGQGSLYYNNTGSANVAIGYQSNHHNQTGSNNTILGHEAGRGSATHDKSGNVFVGYQAGYNETSSDKLYVENSSSALPLIWGDFSTNDVKINGDFHVTGNITTDGTLSEINNLADAIHIGSSLFLGIGAGGNDDGSNNWNTSVGYNSLNSNQDGNSNTAVGFSAMSNNTSGVSNIAIGYLALRDNISNNNNVAIGREALLTSTADNNSAIGHWALLSNTTGQDNVGLGASANFFNEQGSRNTIIGFEAGKGTAAHSKSENVFIGHKAGYYETGDAKLYIDNSATNFPLIWGDFSANRIVINGNSSNNSNNRTFFSNGSAGGTAAWFNDSDRRLKQNISTISNALEKVKNLRGVNYKWKDIKNRTDGTQMGFIAQEANDVIPEVVDNSGEYYSMQYAPITALLVEAVKEQEVSIKTQVSRIEIQEAKIKKLELENEKIRIQNAEISCKHINFEDKVSIMGKIMSINIQLQSEIEKLKKVVNKLVQNKVQVNFSKK